MYFTPQVYQQDSPPTPAVYIPVGVWALKQPISSHLHKITNEPLDYMALAPNDFAAGQRHCLDHKKGWAMKVETFMAQPFNGSRNVFASHQNHNGPRHIINRFINSYNIRTIH